MLLNVAEFKKFLQKATIDYYIDSVQLNYDNSNDVVWSKMRASSSEVAAILKMKNNIFYEVQDNISLNFTSPRTEVKPFLDLLDIPEAELKVNEKNVVINDQLRIQFKDPSVITALSPDAEDLWEDMDYFVDRPIDDSFLDSFGKIKKIGSRFGKIYLTVSNNKLYIESMDKTDPYSNGVSFFICDVSIKDMELCFDYQVFIKLMNVVDKEGFRISVTYLESPEPGGIVYVYREEEEKYFLVTKVLG